jgi:phosphoglycerate dehydrogenase-like enzyme
MPLKVLVAIYYPDALVWNIPAGDVDVLRARFPHISFAHARDHETTLREVRDADVAFSSILRGELLAGATRLRWIHSSAAGVGSLISPELRARGIIVTNSRGLHATTIAEHVVGVTIMLLRKLHVAVRRQAEGRWAQEELSAPDASRSIRGAVIGIVGLGAIGSGVARAMAALGAEVRAIRRRPTLPVPDGVAWVGGPDELSDLLRRADVVVLAAPQTGATRGLIGAREMGLMRRDAFLVNVSRGKIVDEGALVQALTDGTIAGAALDVFEHEPLDPASPLWRLPNVIVTPHSSGFRQDYWQAVVDLFTENLRRFERREPLLNVVNLDVGY